jgi:hypothetical protein
MKAIFYSLSLLIIIMSSSVKAQDNDEVKDAPAKVKSEFAKLYPTVKEVKWHGEEGNFEGNFLFNNKEMSVEMTEKGELVEVEITLKISELPKTVQDFIAKNYSGAKIDEISELRDEKNLRGFEVDTKEQLLIFDSKGIFVKAVKLEDD